MRYHLNFRDLDETTENATRFHREAAKLRKHVIDFKPELVDLHGTLVTLPRGLGFTAHMRIHLPTGTLSAEGRGYTRVAAWTDAVQELEVRLGRHKARLSGARGRRRRRLDREQRWDVAGVAHENNGHGVRTSIQAGYPELLDFLRTEVRLHERKGNLPRGFVDPVELAGVVAVRALKEAKDKPADLSYEHWFFKMAYEQVLEATDEARRTRFHRHEPPALETVLPRPEGREGLVDEEDLLAEWFRAEPRPRFGHDIPDPRSLA
jgi:ribosome-associated translation inhibitor RaiA